MNQEKDKPTDSKTKRKAEQPESLSSDSLKTIESATKKPHSNASKNQSCEKHKSSWPVRIEAVCAVLLVIITGFYTYYAKKQAGAATIASQAATESLKTIKDQFQLDQRPYVLVNKLQMIDKTTKKSSAPVRGRPLLVNLQISNLGKSPALNVIIHRHLLFGEYIFKQLRVNPPDIGKSYQIIAQTQDVIVTAISIKDTFANETSDISPSEILQWDGTDPIIVFGRITYEDNRGELYCTPFLSRYISPSMWERESSASVKARKFTFITTDLCPAGKTF